MTTLHRHQLSPGTWAPADSVEIRENQLHFELCFDRVYDLLDAPFQVPGEGGHLRRPHVEFLNLRTENELLGFVKRWGPLAVSDDEVAEGHASQPIDGFWRYRYRLETLVNLLAAVHQGRNERSALAEFLQQRREQLVLLVNFHARRKNWKNPRYSAFFRWLEDFAHAFWQIPELAQWAANQPSFQAGSPRGEVVGLLADVPLPYIRELVTLCVAHAVPPLIGVLELRRMRGKGETYPRFRADDLAEAMQCMIVIDEWSHHPVQLCAYCDRVFRPETNHERQYCSGKCARRVSSREYKRKMRAQEKKDRDIRRSQ
jgi:hypothetical protein